LRLGGDSAHMAWRERRVTRTWFDGVDMFGSPVWRCDLDGEPPNPDENEQMIAVGIEAGEPTPEIEIAANILRAKYDRGGSNETS
jgi:hypothetical protein